MSARFLPALALLAACQGNPSDPDYGHSNGDIVCGPSEGFGEVNVLMRFNEQRVAATLGALDLGLETGSAFVTCSRIPVEDGDAELFLPEAALPAKVWQEELLDKAGDPIYEGRLPANSTCFGEDCAAYGNEVQAWTGTVDLCITPTEANFIVDHCN